MCVVEQRPLPSQRDGNGERWGRAAAVLCSVCSVWMETLTSVMGLLWSSQGFN